MNQDNLQLETFQHLLSFCFCLSIYFFSTIVNGLSEKGFRALAQSGPVFFLSVRKLKTSFQLPPPLHFQVPTTTTTYADEQKTSLQWTLSGKRIIMY